MSTGIAVDCTAHITALMETAKVLGESGEGKYFSVYSEDHLFDKSKMLKKPAIGVMYEGIRPNAGDPSRQGLSNDLTVAVVLILDGKAIGDLDQRNAAAEALDAMRACIRTQVSPTKHKWRFAGEFPMGQMNGLVVYVQRWSTMLPITA